MLRRHRFNLVIERLLISGENSSGKVRHLLDGFNLVIERLLISGAVSRVGRECVLLVSISLSSGFSFQGLFLDSNNADYKSFNLVIERLLISGYWGFARGGRYKVSISLSSGFSFQENIRFDLGDKQVVSISLSSGFSFQAHADGIPSLAV